MSCEFSIYFYDYRKFNVCILSLRFLRLTKFHFSHISLTNHLDANKINIGHGTLSLKLVTSKYLGLKP